MSQRKKKVNTYQNQKLANAQHRNEFLRKLKVIINTVADSDVCSPIPQVIFNNIYTGRNHSLKVIVPSGYKVPYEIHWDAKCILSAWLKRENIILTPGNLQITLDEFYTLALTAITLYNSLETSNQAYAHNLVNGLSGFKANIEALFKQASENLYGILYAFGMGVSDMGKTLYWYKHELIETPNLERGIDNIVSLYSHEVESVIVQINNNPRPVKQVSWAFAYTGVDKITIKPSLLNINSPFADIPLNVYIQSHALQRIAERIDCFQTGIIHFNLFSSLKEPKVFHTKSNSIFIEYRMFNTKAGYLPVDIIDGMIIIRTFLFVTNNGTPEGELLENNTGLQKFDKKYLAIDKLSTFMTSDIGSNHEVSQIFNNAGCHCLVELYEKMNEICIKRPKHSVSDLMLDYMKYSNPLIPENIQEETLQIAVNS